MRRIRITLLLTAMLCLGIAGAYAQWNPTGDNVSTGSLTIGSGDSYSYSQLMIKGPNTPSGPDSKRDITFSFKVAGQAGIRAYRGGAWDTNLQFLTSGFSNTGGTPSVRMHISENGNIGIGNTNPQHFLDVTSPFVLGEETTLFVGQDHNFGGNTGRYGIGLSLLHEDGTAEGKTAFLNIWNNNSRRRVMSFSNTGNIGIGTESPQYLMDVISPFVTGEETTLFVGQNHDFGGNTGRYGIGLSLLHESSAAEGKTAFLNLWNNNARTRVMSFTNTGNVGIGTNDPGSFKLAVEGKIGAREIQVTAVTPWPDYVFEEDYNLTDLSEVEQYIKENKHLPGVPTATEVEKDGVNLGEMNVKLLEKVEELTLYIIELKKEIDELKKNNDNE
ncbi:hypothetical protein GCM10009122_28110 [Fulvivirga kasyanovii]|uniref:Uncharacterized protein n=1 Tax=Fulvivirga kasyanovii TaxID=396812 RepID=A0ABW9RQ49_9BACT|nr:hypothetical protein [Fulvivirga kasyanovii]MTI26289.1 hypothetical protein [Fulvivirga kasyanovii]